MKTTLDLPDEIVRVVKIRAVEEKKRFNDMAAEILRRGLARSRGGRVKLPLVECAHEARPDEEMTPERTASVLLEEEAKLQ